MLREEVLVVTIAVRDRGSGAGGDRYVAELEGFAVVRGCGSSPWEAMRRLVVDHRALLERRLSVGVLGREG